MGAWLTRWTERVASLPSRTRITLTTFALLAFCETWRELIPVVGGLGYDGVHYAAWAKNLSWELTSELTTYQLGRLLPSALVHVALRVLHLPMTYPSVIWTFTVANIVLTGLTMNLWCRAAERMGVGERGQWLGFLLLICSFSTLKWSLYYPVLTGSFALALGAGMLLLYLRGNTLGVAAIVIAGAFTWPSIVYVGVPLIAFPHRGAAAVEPAPAKANRIVAVLLGIAVMAGALWAVAGDYELEYSKVRPMASAVKLSAFVAGAFVCAAIWKLLDSRSLWQDLHPRQWLRHWEPWVALSLPILAKGVILWLAGLPSDYGEAHFLKHMLYVSSMQPGVFYLGHVLYFGPLLLLLPVQWADVSRSIREQGTGMILFFSLAAMLALSSESRQLLNLLPFIVLPLALSLERLDWTRGRLATVAALSLLFSKVWMTMNLRHEIPLVGDVTFRFYYDASRGPWMSHLMYFSQGLVVLAVFALFYLWFVWERTPDER